MEENYSQKVIPEDGVVLPANGRFGAKMASVGVIDKAKLEELYAGRGVIKRRGEEICWKVLTTAILKITPENSGFVLNLLWALGLGNKMKFWITGR